MKLIRHFLTAVGIVLATIPASAEVSPARQWIETVSGHDAEWINKGSLKLPSGKIFIGDPSYGGDYHLRNAKSVSTKELDIWIFVQKPEARNESQVLSVWLEAVGNEPVTIVDAIDFGTDSAYFAFGDIKAGQELADIGNLDVPDAEYVPDSFEFFLPHIQEFGFISKALAVPPSDMPAIAIETKRDGGLRAVWLNDANGNLSGILIDILGRKSDRRYLDKLLER